MKRAFVLGLAAAVLVWIAVQAGCRGDGGGGSDSGGYGAAGAVIPGPGQPGYDAELEDFMELYFLQFKLFSSAAVGVGFNEASVTYGADDDKEILNRYFDQYPTVEDFVDFCAQDALCNGKYNALVHNPQDPSSNGILRGFGAFGDTGAFGGPAASGDLLRYAVMRDEGYSDDLVEEARQRAIHCLEFIDIANSIAGVPGVMVRGLRRKDHMPAWTGGVPIPPTPPPPSEPKFGYWREDNTADQRYFAEWGWMDDASKDQMIGWVLAMGIAWDVIAEDPSIPQEYKDKLVVHARNYAHRLMEVAPELGVDMVFRDVEGKLTRHCDFHPNVIVGDGCWSAGVMDQPVMPFNAIMGLGAIRTMYHICGDEDVRDFYYKELIGARRWHEFVRDAPLPIVDMNYATNYSNSDMVFMAFYNAVRYETDPEVRAVLNQALERLWDNGKNERQPKHINQTFFDVIYLGLRAGGNIPSELAGAVDTLKQWPYPLLWAEPVNNCDDLELTQGECLAVDNQTIIELPNKFDSALYQYYVRGPGGNIIEKKGFGHNNTIVAEFVVPRRLRSPSNYDWRSDPFEPNQGGRGSNPYEIEAVGDIIPAYWLGRYLKAGPGGAVSPVGRKGAPPDAPAGLMAAAVSESEIDLAWTDATNKEDGFAVERRRADQEDFQEVGQVGAGVINYSDTGLSAMTTYLYRIVAINDVGDSPPSNTAPATTFAAPAAPPPPAENLVAAALDHASIQLAWNDTSSDEQGFMVVRNDVGVVTTTLADVTGYTDTGLADDTLYSYTIVAVNSAGNAPPSNQAWATTPKLPSIFAVSPLEDAVNVAIAVGEIKVGFGDPVTAVDVEITVSDEVGPIGGTWSLNPGGTELTFVPDPPLLTMSTEYSVGTSVAPVLYEYTFNTEGPGWLVDVGAGAGKSFAIDVFGAELVEPPALRELLVGLDLAAYLLIGVLAADPVAEEMDIIGALGDLDGPDPSKQDMGSPSLLFPVPADLSGNPAWAMGPFDFPITIEGFEVLIEQVSLSGIFEENYSYFGKGELQGDLDLGLIAGLVGISPAEICVVAGGCLGCPGDPGRVECIHLYIRNMRAEPTDPIIPIASPTGKDLGGTATEHDVEVTLVDPATGDPESGVDIMVAIDVGNGLIEGAVFKVATTGADGKTTVVLTDLDGGSDELSITIESAVPYAWVKSKVIVAF